ncbi:hypothetical protein F751_0922 [Auxenochlorella protothecoides]|uniref:Uncharacterized protein n=1 Tax=Auxenochlorella protothecoides TaxID=3075 RepID=A0A087SDA4_AUXPR|nr:hypothetical protein F751_0922 [Auxenochlorella protothecoides]KFM23708.1 hypothetical protein F751_0922 [Auxenochlorella protothecoides]
MNSSHHYISQQAIGMSGLTQANAVVFLPWVISLFGWFLLLCGVAALQSDCSSSGANAIVRAGAAGYFSPVPCSQCVYGVGSFYGFTWWITVYLFILSLLLPILMTINGIRRFRAGLIGLVAVELMLLMDLINSFLYFNTIPTVSGALLARGRVVLAGAIIAAIGLFAVLIGLGLQDERDPELHSKRVGAGSGETRGGRFVDPGNDKANVVAYNNPIAEE